MINIIDKFSFSQYLFLTAGLNESKYFEKIISISPIACLEFSRSLCILESLHNSGMQDVTQFFPH